MKAETACPVHGLNLHGIVIIPDLCPEGISNPGIELKFRPQGIGNLNTLIFFVEVSGVSKPLEDGWPRFYFVLLLCAMVFMSIAFYEEAQAQSKIEELNIYTDKLENGWTDWSWGSALDFSNKEPVQNGTDSIAVTYTQAWAGVYLNTSEIIPGTAYHELRFWIHDNASGGHQLNVMLVDENYTILSNAAGVTTLANTWTEVVLPVSQLGMPTGISGIIWQETSGDAQPTFFLDEISFRRYAHLLKPKFCISIEDGPALSIDAGSILHVINPDIYGMKAGSMNRYSSSPGCVIG